MNDAGRMQLRERIEAGRTRQQARARLTGIAREHPFLLVAGGLVAGVALSALLPRSPTRKLGRNTLGLATAIAKMGLSYGRQAAEKAEGAARGRRVRLDSFKDALARRGQHASALLSERLED